MARKPYARTFRYSEETRKILEQYDGDFDELVHYAFFKSREAEEELKRTEESKNSLEIEKSNLIREIKILSLMKSFFSKLMVDYDTLQNTLSNVITELEKM